MVCICLRQIQYIKEKKIKGDNTIQKNDWVRVKARQ